MIKDIKRYLIESEKEREAFLKSLSYKDSAKIVEGLLSSKILFKMFFKEDDNPISLYKQIELRRKLRK